MRERARPCACPVFLLFFQLLLQLRDSWALRLPEAEPDRTYLFHESCPTWDGLGGHAIKIRPYVDMALKRNWTFVCNPEDWDTSLHHTANMGYLFGCINESTVVGDLASLESVKHLPWKDVNTLQDSSHAQKNSVYKITECRHMPPWGESWKWYRSQYHLVRTLDPNRQRPQCWPEEPRQTNVVLAVRKGDDRLRAFHAHTYIRLLTKLMEGQLPHVTLNSDRPLHIVVISETVAADADMVLLRRFFIQSNLTFSFFLGMPETDQEKSRARLIRDLDCMTQSDILMLSQSKFSDIAAGCQLPPGISLVLKEKHRHKRNDSLPNTVNLQGEITHLALEGAQEEELSFLPSEDELPHSLDVSTGQQF